MNVHKYGNSWMTNKQMRKLKNIAINQIYIIANYHIDLEFCLQNFPIRYQYQKWHKLNWVTRILPNILLGHAHVCPNKYEDNIEEKDT